MGYIKNFETLAINHERRVVLELIESALASIQPQKILAANFVLRDNFLAVGRSPAVNLEDFERIFLVGFGKGSAKISSIIEEVLGEKLTDGWVIDVSEEALLRIKFTLGTHPLPSQ